MKKFLAFAFVAASTLGGLCACRPDQECKMNIMEIVVDSTGNHLAYCEPVKTFKLKHYVDIPELDDYSEYTTFIATEGTEKSYFLLEGGKKVDDGKYKFARWGE